MRLWRIECYARYDAHFSYGVDVVIVTIKICVASQICVCFLLLRVRIKANVLLCKHNMIDTLFACLVFQYAYKSDTAAAAAAVDVVIAFMPHSRNVCNERQTFPKKIE